MNEKIPNNFEGSKLQCKQDPDTKRIQCVIKNPENKQLEEKERQKALLNADEEIKKL